MYPKVSVLVPVYNASQFLRATINSVLHQTYTDFELILLNDYSTDNSEKIISEFHDERIRYYKNDKNLGISPSRNKLMDLAKGEYLAVLDNDDIMKPNRLEKQVMFLDEHPDVSAVGSYFELFDSVGQKNIRKFILSLGIVWCHPQVPKREDWLKGIALAHPTAMIRRKDFTKNGIKYDEIYTPAEDYDLFKQAVFKGLKLANIPEVLMLYNLHGDNCSIQQKEKIVIATKKIQHEVSQFLGQPFKKYPRWKFILEKMRLRFFI